MTEYKAIAQTDEVNRYNQVFSLRAMYSAYNKQWNELLPFGVNHHSEKSIGVSKLTGIYLEPGTAYMTNSFSISDSKEESEKINRFNLESQYQKNVLDHIDDYNRLIDSVKCHIIGEHKKLWRNGVMIFNEGIVERLFPELCSKSKDGLIDITMLSPVLPGIYKKGNLLIFAHRFFRRGCSYLNSLNVPFLSRIDKFDQTTLHVRIAIDMDCVGLAGTEHEELEYQYWWGPKFNDDLNSIPLGVTRHENEHYDPLMSEIRCTEFGWYIQDDKHTFECEEIIDVPNARIDGVSMYACRFVHSMVDKETGAPIHLDGAIRAYDDEKMLERLEINIDKCERKAYYKKLWRIDGPITITKWKELITHYYRDNMLVGEYFGGCDKIIDSIRETDSKPEKDALTMDSYIPCNLNSGDGIRIYFSFSDQPQINEKYNIYIRPTSYFEKNGNRTIYIESETVSLFKHLKQKGFSVRFPNTKKVSFCDLIYNYPIFECRDIDCANAVIESMSLFCNKWNENADDRLVSFTVKVAYSERIGTFSFLGHVNDFATFFNAGFNHLPEEAAIYEWLSQAYEFISKHFKNNSIVSPLSTIEGHGVIRVKRRFVEPRVIQTLCDKDGQFSICLPEKEKNFIISNNITASLAFIVEKSKCSKCKRDYIECDCISLLDEDVIEEIQTGTPVGLVWTTRSLFPHGD